MLGLYERADLAKDAAVVDEGRSSLEFSLGHLVARRGTSGLARRSETAITACWELLVR